MASKESHSGVETGLRYRKPQGDGGDLTVINIGGAAPELRIRAEEMNLIRPEAEAVAVYRHVIYEDWQPITRVTVEPHPTIRGQIVHKVS